MTKNAIALVYNRKAIVSNKEEDAGVILYHYVLHDVVKGFENDSFDKKTFFAEDDTQYPYIEDIIDLDESYVYAFPYYTTNVKRSKQEEIYNDMLDEISEYMDFDLFQFYSESESELKTIASKDSLKTFTRVDPSNYSGYHNIYTAQYLPLYSLQPEESKSETSENLSKLPNVSIITPKREILSTREMFENITKSIICQDDQVRSIVTGFAKNQRITSAIELNPDMKDSLSEEKQNFFICGPTGVGKTAIFRCLAKYANVPIVFEDATRYTMEGYVGESPEGVLKNLLRASNNDVELAKKGIVVVDEIDKKATSNHVSPATTKEVQSSFLTMMNGQEYPLNISSSKVESKIIPFDTSTVTFAFLGAYSGIEQYYEKESSKMGFGADVLKKGTVDDYTRLYSPENLIKYGMLAEFIGRGNVISLNGLDNVEAMKKIILESDKSPATINKMLYSLFGIDLKIDDDAIEALARKAIAYKAGARGIKKAFDEILGVKEFDIFSDKTPKEVIITEEAVEEPQKLVLKY